MRVASSIGRDSGAVAWHSRRRWSQARTAPIGTGGMRAVARLLRECHIWIKNVTHAGMDGDPAAARVLLGSQPNFARSRKPPDSQ
jgi:hypothetical protein